MATDWKDFALKTASAAVASAISFGTYGTLRDRGWGSWTAGAATGVVGAVLGMLILKGSEMAAAAAAKNAIAPTAGLVLDPVRGFGLLTSEKLGASYPPPRGGLSFSQLGAYDVNLRTGMPIG
jgi:hypothetical protein